MKLIHIMAGLAALFMVLLINGCNNSAGVLDTAPSINEEAFVYKVGVGDKLAVNVWRSDELSVEVIVRPDGKITLPLIGDVDVKEKTVDELTIEITESLQSYVRSPQVTVAVLNPVSSNYQMRVRVTGAVNQQISVPFRDGMTVLDLVLEAGGTTIYSAPNRARLVRKDAENIYQSYAVRLGDILEKGDLTTNYTLQPSDVITIPERNL